MAAESIFDPIPEELIRRARARLTYDGESIESWARREGFSAKSVYKVLEGRRMCIRGKSFQIAVKLGLRPDPDNPAPAAQEGLPSPAPVGSSVADLAPVPARNRRPLSQLGDAAR